jgi:glycerol uptake facilitator-like aquaporin
VTVIGLPRRLLAAFLGTALLVTVVVGSGIAAAQLSPEDVGVQLLENSTASAATLIAGRSPRPVLRREWF